MTCVCCDNGDICLAKCTLAETAQWSAEAMGEGYSWAPPGLSPARVEEYMRQLPVDKVSIQLYDAVVSCYLNAAFCCAAKTRAAMTRALVKRSVSEIHNANAAFAKHAAVLCPDN